MELSEGDFVLVGSGPERLLAEVITVNGGQASLVVHQVIGENPGLCVLGLLHTVIYEALEVLSKIADQIISDLAVWVKSSDIEVAR